MKMKSTRRDFLKYSALLAGSTVVPIGALSFSSRLAHAQTTTTFDYYISPTGNDTNDGKTESTAWAITAINTKQALYSGKKVGLLDGTYPMYSLLNGGIYSYAGLLVNGSNDPVNPTVIQSVNPRKAILDGHQAPGTVGIGYPSGTAPMIGVGQGDHPPYISNIVIDGLVVTGSNSMGIHFFGSNSQTITVAPGQNYSGRSYGGATGIVVRNCEVYDIYSTSFGNNPNAIGADFVTGMIVQNCKIHPMINSSAPPVQGILTFNTNGNIYEYNTIYSCGSAIEEKEGPQGDSTVRYNYLEGFNVDGLGTIREMSGGIIGMTTTFHNNIVVGPLGWNTESSTNPSQFSQERIVVYNNTFYYGGGGFNDTGFSCHNWGPGDATVPPAMLTHYNNIYYCTGTSAAGSDVIFTSGAIGLSDYNSYRPIVTNTNLLYLNPQGATSLTGYTLSAWQNVTAQDAHSIATHPNFVNPTSANPNGYQLAGTYGNSGSSSGVGAGRLGGVASGAPCNLGAWDGKVTQIGCDFTSSSVGTKTPMAPILTKVA